MVVVNNFWALGSALSLSWLALKAGSESLYCTISVENINGYIWLVIAATVAIDINIMMMAVNSGTWCNNWSVYRLSLNDHWSCSSVMVSRFRFLRFFNWFRFHSLLRFRFSSSNNNSVVDVWVMSFLEDFSRCNLFGSWSCLYNFLYRFLSNLSLD